MRVLVLFAHPVETSFNAPAGEPWGYHMAFDPLSGKAKWKMPLMETDRNGLEVPTTQECLDLVRRAVIGRLAIHSGALPTIALQQHWDANEMDKIAEFVTPQMLEFLKRERADLGDGFQSTYIDNLNVQLDGVDDRADKTIATLTFTGVSKTSRFDQGEVFSESWNMERAQGENQPWLVAGIRQNG